MKKILIILFTLLLILTGCKKEPVELEVGEVFNNNDTSGSIEIIEGNKLDLTQYLMTDKGYVYSYNLTSVEIAQDENNKLEYTPLDSNELTFKEAGEFILSLHGEDKDGNYANFYKTIKVITIEDALGDSLDNIEKNTDLESLLNEYGLKYEGTVDTSKAGIYSIKITDSNDESTAVYKTIVVAKEELEDDKAIIEDQKSSNTLVSEDETMANNNTSVTSSSNNLDTSDPRIALAYSWEGIGGNCGQVAFNYAQAIGYLKDFTFEDFLLYQVTDKFEHLDSPVPFSTLIEYDNGAHVAIYLGDGMALHGNYTGDYANGNGKAKVASMYITGMNITSYKNMDVTTKISNNDLKNEIIEGSTNNANTNSSNSTTGSSNTNSVIKEDCDELNNSGEGTCILEDDGDLTIVLPGHKIVFNNDNPMTENSYDSSLCARPMRELSAMYVEYPQLDEFCAIYYPDLVDWSN